MVRGGFGAGVCLRGIVGLGAGSGGRVGCIYRFLFSRFAIFITGICVCYYRFRLFCKIRNLFKRINSMKGDMEFLFGVGGAGG